MTSKRCCRCGLALDVGQFGPRRQNRDGLNSACRKCCAAQVRESKALHPSTSGVEYQRRRDREPAQRKSLKERSRKYESEKRHQKNASQALRYAIQTGKVQRKPCEVCGAEKTHGHHDDYSKPLEVRWLCPSHHMSLHRALRSASSTTKA